MKQQIKAILKMIFIQSSMICFGISLINGILIAVTHNYGGELKIDYLFPLSIVVCSILCGCTILVFTIHKIPFIAQCIIHFLLLVGIVTGTSFAFHWVTEWIDLLVVYGVLLVVYITIWFITYNDTRKNAERMNKVLENNRDED